jgi:Tfp pilus assembly protein PilP
MKRRTWKITMAALGLLILVMASGCGGGEEAPAAPPAGGDTKPDKSKLAPAPSKDSKAPRTKTSDGPALSASRMELLKEWRYLPDTKWDPFVVPPPREQAGEKYSLDQMILYGIIWGSGYDRAFIRLPDNTDRILKVGDVIGKHNGVVTQIQADKIIVEEKWIDPERPDEIYTIQKVMNLVKLKK